MCDSTCGTLEQLALVATGCSSLGEKRIAELASGDKDSRWILAAQAGADLADDACKVSTTGDGPSTLRDEDICSSVGLPDTDSEFESGPYARLHSLEPFVLESHNNLADMQLPSELQWQQPPHSGMQWQCSQWSPECPPCSALAALQDYSWFQVAYRGGLEIHDGPFGHAQRTGALLTPDEMVAVSRELPGTDCRLYLQLADGRGWIFDDSVLMPHDPSVLRCQWDTPVPSGFRDAAVPANNMQEDPVVAWFRVAYEGGINLRSGPSINAPLTGGAIALNEVVSVSEKVHSTDGRVYLRLCDGRGWVFDDSALMPNDPSMVFGNWRKLPDPDTSSCNVFSYPPSYAAPAPPASAFPSQVISSGHTTPSDGLDVASTPCSVPEAQLRKGAKAAVPSDAARAALRRRQRRRQTPSAG